MHLEATQFLFVVGCNDLCQLLDNGYRWLTPRERDMNISFISRKSSIFFVPTSKGRHETIIPDVTLYSLEYNPHTLIQS
jgi:hypothetical protein